MNMALVCLLLAAVATTAFGNEAKFNLHIKEKSSHFVQEIEADMYRNQVKYHTPAHNDVVESRKMQDFKTGYQVSCLMSIKECFLSKVNTTHYPHAGKTVESIARMWNEGDDHISDDQVTTIRQKWVVTKEILNTTFMSPEMRQFYEAFNMPLYEVEKVDEKNIITGLVSKQHVRTSDGNLLPADRRCAQDAAPIRRYGYTGTRGCDWLVFCDSVQAYKGGSYNQLQTATSNCQKTHVSDEIFYSCLCCKEAHTVSSCLRCVKL